MNRFLELLEVALTLAVALITLAVFIGFPLWMLYSFVAPFFGANPIGHLKSVSTEVFKVAAVAMSIAVVVMLVGRISARWRPVRVVLKALAYLFLALVIVSSLVRCISDGPDICAPSRYSAC